MKNSFNTHLGSAIFALSVAILFASMAQGQTAPQYDKKSDPAGNRRDGINMLKDIKRAVTEYYFDSKYRGIDLDAHFRSAEERIKTQEFRWQIHRTIAQVLLDFNDSHTSFIPPDRLYRVEYGFSMMMIGNSCFVTDVKAGSDAMKKGLKPGDRIIEFGGLIPTRESLNTITYLVYVLDPQETVKLKIASADGRQTEINVASRFLSPDERNGETAKRKKDEQSKPYRCAPLNADVVACKLRTFSVDTKVIDKMMAEASPYKKLILDLRGNGGGYVETGSHFTGYFFDRAVKIGTEIRRDKKKDRITKLRKNPYGGELYVLIDSESASAAEVFARTMQIESRGKVIGDTSMGAVMTSYSFGMAIDARTAVLNAYRVWGLNITVGDLVMSDGNRLEAIGVAPDYPVGPTPMALLERNDPVLAFAAELAGTPITPEKAGELYFFLPKAEEQNDRDVDNKKDK